MKVSSFITIMFLSINLWSQKDSINHRSVNSADILLESEETLTIGAYGQVDYNQPLNSEVRQNGNLDVHRLVMLFGYKFNYRTNFITEIEYEHVKEVYIEQAFINYKINDFLNFRGGLLLIPMGIINEYHESAAFNGVERPNLDKVIVPTTWREIGVGFSGRFNAAALKYQIYVINGFNGYDGEANFSGTSGLRSGRQKGAKSFMSSPGISSRIDYYGLRRLKIGFSVYEGKSNSTLYDGIDKKNTEMIKKADSSVVGINMIGADFRYNLKGVFLKGQYYFIKINNSEQYNEFSNSDLGSRLGGFYGEISYNLFRNTKLKTELVPFFRYENYNTQYAVNYPIIKNKAYHKKEFIFGFGWKLVRGAVLKADFQIIKSDVAVQLSRQLNIGVGIMF